MRRRGRESVRERERERERRRGGRENEATVGLGHSADLHRAAALMPSTCQKVVEGFKVGAAVRDACVLVEPHLRVSLQIVQDCTLLVLLAIILFYCKSMTGKLEKEFFKSFLSKAFSRGKNLLEDLERRFVQCNYAVLAHILRMPSLAKDRREVRHLQQKNQTEKTPKHEIKITITARISSYED